MSYVCMTALGVLAAYLAWRLGWAGVAPPRLVPKNGERRNAERRAAILARNIDCYDGTGRGQREVK